MKNYLFIICAFSLFAWGCAETKTTTSNPSEISIPLGETATLDGHTVTFEKVLEDSRCPKDAQCIWNGRIILQFQVKKQGAASETMKIYVGATREGESKSKVVFSSETGIWQVQLVRPSAVQGEKIETYSVLLQKTPKV